ncbi:MAG: hypothetical protein JO189_08210 [Deltaproteobacteria bacterium]|nr:hypothetical protein [Deltaproteobacteria bacterium]
MLRTKVAQYLPRFSQQQLFANKNLRSSHCSPRKLEHGSFVARVLGLFGGMLLAAGADAPLIHIPIVGTISYLRHPSYFSTCNIGELVILAAAGLSIISVLLKRFKLLWATGTIALAQLIVTLASFQHSAAAVIAKADQPDLVDPMLMWAGAVLHQAHLEWGIAAIGAGAVILLAAAVAGSQHRPAQEIREKV